MRNTHFCWVFGLCLVTLKSCFSRETAGSVCHTAAPVFGYALSDRHVISTTIRENLERCIIWCERCQSCFSINYCPASKQCQLNRATKDSHPVDFVRKPGCTYINMVVRAYTCVYVPCENGGTCQASPRVHCRCRPGYLGWNCEGLHRRKVNRA